MSLYQADLFSDLFTLFLKKNHRHDPGCQSDGVIIVDVNNDSSKLL